MPDAISPQIAQQPELLAGAEANEAVLWLRRRFFSGASPTSPPRSVATTEALPLTTDGAFVFLCEPLARLPVMDAVGIETNVLPGWPQHWPLEASCLHEESNTNDDGHKPASPRNMGVESWTCGGLSKLGLATIKYGALFGECLHILSWA